MEKLWYVQCKICPAKFAQIGNINKNRNKNYCPTCDKVVEVKYLEPIKNKYF